MKLLGLRVQSKAQFHSHRRLIECGLAVWLQKIFVVLWSGDILQISDVCGTGGRVKQATKEAQSIDKPNAGERDQTESILWKTKGEWTPKNSALGQIYNHPHGVA
jgi:hypothetical protein